MILGGGVVATVIAGQFKDDITRGIQGYENYEDLSNIGDGYGTTVNSIIPQAGIYAIGLATKNEKIREFGLLTTHAGIASGLLTLALKGIVNSDRPDDSSRSRFRSSFPSGHALGTAALAGTIHRRYGILYAVPFQLASLNSGLSRIFDNKHRSHEVVVGWGLGYATGYAIARAWKKVKPGTRRFTLMPWIDPDTKTLIGLSIQVRF